jgi:WD40 repeat protein
VRLWDGDSGKLIKTLEPAEAHYVSVVFSPDNKRLLGIGYGSSAISTRLTLWDVETGKVLQTFNGHAGGTQRAIFSPDGSRIAAEPDAATAVAAMVYYPEITVWDVASGNKVLALPAGGLKPGTLEFSPDGHRMRGVNLSPHHSRDMLKEWDGTPLPEPVIVRP